MCGSDILRGGRQHVQEQITREEVSKAITRLRGGKAPGVDGISAEMLKYGGDAVVEWMLLISSLAWDQGVVPEDYGNAIIVPLYKGKGSRQECGNYSGTSLLTLSVPGKVYGRVLNRHMQYCTCEILNFVPF